MAGGSSERGTTRDQKTLVTFESTRASRGQWVLEENGMRDTEKIFIMRLLGEMRYHAQHVATTFAA